MKNFSISFNHRFFTSFSFYFSLVFVGRVIFKLLQHDTSEIAWPVSVAIVQGVYAFTSIKRIKNRKGDRQ
ncbi:hypothetical protein ACFQ22_06485 [Lentilactobacillus raoultii]|uniref:Uncharacterized protein n=1 Tax=Lentilactobacillus raoultii TaxID=1987503 RepID=A0ABW3PNS4_9LACO|nr:hypothetical protein [Lentilactobacillus raoultii]